MSGPGPPSDEQEPDPAGREPDPEAATEIATGGDPQATRSARRLGQGGAERFLAAVTSVNVLVTLLAVVAALAIGAVIIALSDPEVREALGYVTARPSDTIVAAWRTVSEAYAALFRGSVGGARALSETLTAAIPLILTGLAVAVPLRGGMFNIGGEGQLVAGAIVAGWIGFTFPGLPLVVHLPLAVIGGTVGGLVWGFLPGVLKARTGAHEVITTIMLNNIAINLFAFLLTTRAFQQPGRNDPISQAVDASARLPALFTDLRLHAGIFLALLAAGAVWWLLERSTDGFEIVAVGMNPNAAATAGMSVGRATIVAMTVAGALAGLAGAGQVLGLQHRLSLGISAGLGFDGITVALLGRGGVTGTVAAGLLFGGLKAGGLAMQARTGTSLDLVVVIQALIILFIAAPALVQALFRIRGAETAAGEISKGWGT